MTPSGRRTGRPGLEHRGQREQTAPAGPADSSPNRRQWRQMGSGWRSGMVRAVGDGELVAALSELRIRKTPSPGTAPYAPRSGGHRQQRAMAADRGAALSTNRQQPWSAGTATATVRVI